MTTKRIIRAPRSADHPYFVCRRAPAQDKRLTWESRGVLWYILSKPDDWEVLEKDLMQHCGRDKVKKILKELEEKGYLVREQTRTKTEKGQTRYGALTFQVQEIPIQLTESQLTETQLTETQLTENPDHTEKEERSTETTEDTEKLAQPDKSVAPAPQSDQTVSDVVEEPPVSTPAPKARKPKRNPIPKIVIDPMKDAIAAAFGLNWDTMTEDEKSSVQVAARKLCAVKVNAPQPAEVQHIYAYCKATFTHFTPYALSAHLNASRQWNGVKLGGSNAQHDDFRPAPRDDSKYAIRKREPGSIPPEVLAARATRQNPLVPRGLPRTELATGVGGLPDVRRDESGDEERAA